MEWTPMSAMGFPDLKNFKKIKEVYQSTQDPICFLIISEEGWCIAYERYGGQARMARNLPWAGPPS